MERDRSVGVKEEYMDEDRTTAITRFLPPLHNNNEFMNKSILNEDRETFLDNLDKAYKDLAENFKNECDSSFESVKASKKMTIAHDYDEIWRIFTGENPSPPVLPFEYDVMVKNQKDYRNHGVVKELRFGETSFMRMMVDLKQLYEYMTTPGSKPLYFEWKGGMPDFSENSRCLMSLLVSIIHHILAYFVKKDMDPNWRNLIMTEPTTNQLKEFFKIPREICERDSITYDLKKLRNLQLCKSCNILWGLHRGRECDGLIQISPANSIIYSTETFEERVTKIISLISSSSDTGSRLVWIPKILGIMPAAEKRFSLKHYHTPAYRIYNRNVDNINIVINPSDSTVQSAMEGLSDITDPFIMFYNLAKNDFIAKMPSATDRFVKIVSDKWTPLALTVAYRLFKAYIRMDLASYKKGSDKRKAKEVIYGTKNKTTSQILDYMQGFVMKDMKGKFPNPLNTENYIRTMSRTQSLLKDILRSTRKCEALNCEHDFSESAIKSTLSEYTACSD